MDNNKAILITGTSTGIGKACALHLDKLGFKIYAGVRKQVDGDNLKKEASQRLTPVILDVTGDEAISSAAQLVAKETGGELYGLVNNAGIALSGVLEATPADEIRKLMDVNVTGLLAVTKAFTPMLRKGKGRIVNIGSASGHVAFPGLSVYCASKFAVRAISDALRVELNPFGMNVILVAPGPVESDIWDKVNAYKEELRKTIDPELLQLYAPLIRFGDKIHKTVKIIPAHEVAKDVAHAFTAKKPKLYYMVGGEAKGAAIAAKLPKKFLDWVTLKRIKKLGAQ